MPIYHANVTLTASPQMVVPPDVMSQKVYLHNMTKSSNEYIFIGGPNITVSNTIHIDPGESITIVIGPGDDLYAISDPVGLELGVLAVRQD